MMMALSGALLLQQAFAVYLHTQKMNNRINWMMIEVTTMATTKA